MARARSRPVTSDPYAYSNAWPVAWRARGGAVRSRAEATSPQPRQRRHRIAWGVSPSGAKTNHNSVLQAPESGRHLSAAHAPDLLPSASASFSTSLMICWKSSRPRIGARSGSDCRISALRNPSRTARRKTSIARSPYNWRRSRSPFDTDSGSKTPCDPSLAPIKGMHSARLHARL